MKNFENTVSIFHKHPKGGAISIRPLSPVSCEVCDTRKLNGKRRSVRGVVYQCGNLGWKVVHNPGPSSVDRGYFATMTACGAWEASL